jgi:hypothetical protein
MFRSIIASIALAGLAFLILLTPLSRQAQARGSQAPRVQDQDTAGARAYAAPQRGKPTPTPDLYVTGTIVDYIDVPDSVTAEPQRFWLNVRSDGRGSYTNSEGRSFIQGSSGDWYLDTETSSRQVFLDFSKPIPGTGPDGGAPTPPFNSALVRAGLVTKCHLYNNNWFSIPIGATVTCPLSIFFESNSTTHLLQMNPVIGGYVFPETDVVNVTCQAGQSSQCSSWTVSPQGAKGGCLTSDCSLRQNVARLSRLTTVKGKTVVTNLGNFLVSFKINVTNP